MLLLVAYGKYTFIHTLAMMPGAWCS